MNGEYVEINIIVTTELENFSFEFISIETI